MSSTPLPLGKLAGEDAGRDAIHIAVAPVVASEVLSPGAHIGIDSDGLASPQAKHIGIVDPYLTRAVKAGERFYLCLYPNTIQSLRHHWVHPAFKDEGPPPPEELPAPVPDKAASEAWLRAYAKRVNPQYAEGGYYWEKDGQRDTSYDVLMDDLRGNTITYHGIDMHSRSELKDEAELAYHAGIVLGRPVNFDSFEYFSCSC